MVTNWKIFGMTVLYFINIALAIISKNLSGGGKLLDNLIFILGSTTMPTLIFVIPGYLNYIHYYY